MRLPIDGDSMTKILIVWLIASALGLLFWYPLGRAAKRGDKDVVSESNIR